jgi:hypothetical protein
MGPVRTPATDHRVVRVAGIDFGTRAVHAVFLSGTPGSLPTVDRVCLAMGDAGHVELASLCGDVSHVGIDAPDAQTAGCLLPGIRAARCAEVALAAVHHGLGQRIIGGPVSMLTPSAGAVFPARLDWMRRGFELWDLLRTRCPDVEFFETYPSGSFTRLARRGDPPVRLVPRSTAAGVAQRASMMAPLVAAPPFLAMWGLDGVDALAAAVAAYRVAVGTGFVVAAHDHRGNDGSTITLID